MCVAAGYNEVRQHRNHQTKGRLAMNTEDQEDEEDGDEKTIHIEYICDSSDIIVDANYYCSDLCHREGAKDYGAGKSTFVDTNAGHEIISPTTCDNCGADLPVAEPYKEEEEDFDPYMWIMVPLVTFIIIVVVILELELYDL